jgi:hypothetical protein
VQNITIGRFEKDPQAQGCIEPADKRWQLVIDKDGYPHLYVEVNIADDNGVKTKGMFCLEDMMNITVKELMDEGEFGGALPPEEEEEAMAEYLASREKTGIPCPRKL